MFIFIEKVLNLFKIVYPYIRIHLRNATIAPAQSKLLQARSRNVSFKKI